MDLSGFEPEAPAFLRQEASSALQGRCSITPPQGFLIFSVGPCDVQAELQAQY